MTKSCSILIAVTALTLGATSNVFAAETTAPEGKIDINTADIPTLEAIPEIGTSFANAVVAARPFKSVYELQPILKISAEKMVALHAKVTALPPKTPAPLAPQPTAKPSSAQPKATPVPGPSASLTTDQERAEARRQHIRHGLMMPQPPPPARAETKPDSPGENYVWKPGHWAPAQGEWKWTPGEWAVPPTSISLWIEGTYDPQTQRWSPGYWEPDKIQTAESDK